MVIPDVCFLQPKAPQMQKPGASKQEYDEEDDDDDDDGTSGSEEDDDDEEGGGAAIEGSVTLLIHTRGRRYRGVSNAANTYQGAPL